MWARGESYEAYMGRWSRAVAERFLKWLALPAGFRWLDIGCGTGTLTSAVLQRCEPAAVLGVDPSPAFVEYATAHVRDERARFAVSEAAGVPRASADAVVSGLVLNFLPDPAAGLTAMCAAAPGGVVAAYVWDYRAGMQFLRLFWDTAAALNPAAADLDEGRLFPLCNPDALADLWRQAGLADVATTAIDVPTVFRDFADLWRPFLGGQGPAPGYLASLTEDARDRLRVRLHAGSPVADDGSIRLAARSWAVRGYVPA